MDCPAQTQVVVRKMHDQALGHASQKDPIREVAYYNEFHPWSQLTCGAGLGNYQFDARFRSV